MCRQRLILACMCKNTPAAGAGCHQLTVGKKQSKVPPAGAPQAVLQLLFLLVHRLEMAHALDVAPKRTQFQKDSASWCVEQVNKAKHCLSRHHPLALLFMMVRLAGNMLSTCKLFFRDSCVLETSKQFLP